MMWAGYAPETVGPITMLPWENESGEWRYTVREGDLDPSPREAHGYRSRRAALRALIDTLPPE